MPQLQKEKNDQKPRPSNFLLSKAPTDVRAYDGTTKFPSSFNQITGQQNNKFFSNLSCCALVERSVEGRNFVVPAYSTQCYGRNLDGLSLSDHDILIDVLGNGNCNVINRQSSLQKEVFSHVRQGRRWIDGIPPNAIPFQVWRRIPSLEKRRRNNIYKNICKFLTIHVPRFPWEIKKHYLKMFRKCSPKWRRLWNFYQSYITGIYS